MKRYRIIYNAFVNRDNGEGWVSSSNGSMGTYETMEEVENQIQKEIKHNKECYESTEVIRDGNECVIKIESVSWVTDRKKLEVRIYKIVEFDLEKYAKEWC